MHQYRKILVPVDGSQPADLAFERALDFARMVDGEVTIVNVTSHMVESPGPVTVPQKIDFQKISSEILEGYLDRVKDSDLEVLSVTRHGIPADEIVDLSRDFDMIIMGSRGHNPVTSMLIGSVAEKVAREACCPVMIVREKDERCER